MIFEKIHSEGKAVVVFFRKELKLKTPLCLTPQQEIAFGQKISIKLLEFKVKLHLVVGRCFEFTKRHLFAC